MMSQIEKSNGNNTQALSYAQQALQTLPTNKELVDYVNSLKNNSSTPSSKEETPTVNSKTDSKKQ